MASTDGICTASQQRPASPAIVVIDDDTDDASRNAEYGHTNHVNPPVTALHDSTKAIGWLAKGNTPMSPICIPDDDEVDDQACAEKQEKALSDIVPRNDAGTPVLTQEPIDLPARTPENTNTTDVQQAVKKCGDDDEESLFVKPYDFDKNKPMLAEGGAAVVPVLKTAETAEPGSTIEHACDRQP